MPNSILTDSISSTVKFLDTAFELAVEQEILLADYDKSVFKTVKTCVDHTVTQKYINGNRLVCEGFFRISIFYQPPGEEKLTLVVKKQPFRHQLDLPGPVSRPYFINITGSLQYVNTRAVSANRITVSGIYGFEAKGWQSCRLGVVTAINTPTVCCDSMQLPYFALCAAGTRQFSMEEELSLGADIEKILNISTAQNSFTVNTYQDKVNIKGEVTADIYYTTENSFSVSRSSKKISYNQVVDLPGTSENCVAYADFLTTGFTVTADADNGRINCILTACFDVKVFRKESLIAVKDCFSKQYEYENAVKKLMWDANIQAVSDTFNFQVEDTVPAGCRPVYTVLDIQQPVLSAAEGKNTMKAKTTVSVIAISEKGEYECFTKTGDITIGTNLPAGAEDECFVTCTAFGADTTINGDTMGVRFSVEVKGFVINRTGGQVIDSFDEKPDSPLNRHTDALILYFGEKGENLFDIARKYSTDLSVIMAENNIETKILPEEKMLLIPAYRQ